MFKRYYFIGCTYCDFLVVLYYIYWLWIKDERRKCILNDKQATQRCHRGCQARWKLYSLSYSAPNAYPQANQGYSPPPQFGTIPVIQLLTPWTRMPIRLLNSIHVNDVKLSSTTTTLLPTKCLWRSTCPSSGECSSDNNNKRRWNGRRRWNNVSSLQQIDRKYIKKGGRFEDMALVYLFMVLYRNMLFHSLVYRFM